MGLLVVLPGSENRQQILREASTRGVQRMPTIFLGTWSDLPADNRANRLLRLLTLEHRLGFGEADFLGGGTDAHARIFDRYEQVAGQLLPGTHAVGVAAGAQGDIQVGVLRGQV